MDILSEIAKEIEYILLSINHRSMNETELEGVKDYIKSVSDAREQREEKESTLNAINLKKLNCTATLSPTKNEY